MTWFIEFDEYQGYYSVKHKTANMCFETIDMNDATWLQNVLNEREQNSLYDEEEG